jgi:hypothetical protein
MSDRCDALIEAIGGLANRPREPTLFLAYEDNEVAAIADAGEEELTYTVERMAALDLTQALGSLAGLAYQLRALVRLTEAREAAK